MSTGRLEAFSDAVIAIVITILVLELEVPHEPDLAALGDVVPDFLTYVLSFVYLGIYWNNHHHMMALTQLVNGRILWANLHLLFWLSLEPFTTAWMGETDFAETPTASMVRICFSPRSRTTSSRQRSLRTKAQTRGSGPPWGATSRGRCRRPCTWRRSRSRSSVPGSPWA